MSRLISTFLLLLVLFGGIPGFLFSNTSESQETGNTSSLESLEAQNEDILNWADDPLEGLGLEDLSSFYWSASVAAGIGHSDNFLKREAPTSSSFYKLEGDIFLNLLLEKSSLMVLAYFEGLKYDFDTDIDSETLAFLHASWSKFGTTWLYGVELDAFYGDQIYDASLSSNAQPEGARLLQFRPALSVFLERDIGKKDSLRLVTDLERTLYERSEDDYWRPRLRAEWSRAWHPSVKMVTTVGYFQEHYDEEISQDRRGLDMPSDELLLLRGPYFEEELSWSPPKLKKVRIIGRMGATFEMDAYGEYDDAVRLWGSLGTRFNLFQVDMNITGRWQTTRYSYRQVDFFDTRPQEQIYSSLKIEAQRSLPMGLSLRLGVEWSDFNSRISSEQFSERRVEALINWSY